MAADLRNGHGETPSAEPQTRATLLYPARLPLPAARIVGAEAVHRLLVGWRRLLQGESTAPAGLA